MRILVRLPNWIGDVVMATPALRALRAGFADAEIVAVGSGAMLSMLEAARWFDRSIPAPKEKGFLSHYRFGRRLAPERFDLAVLLPNSFSTALQAVVARIPRRIGYVQGGRGPLLTERLYSKRLGRLRPYAMNGYYLAICERLGCPVEKTGRHLELPMPPEARARAAAYLEKRGVPSGAQVVTLNVGAGFGSSKLWTLEGWAGVAAHHLGAGRRVMVLGGPPEKAYVEQVLAAIAAKAGPALAAGALGATDIPIADLAAHLAACALLVSTDSGVRSMGVAAGIPVVCVMGPTHPGYSEVGVGRYFVVLEKTECWPCHLKVCPIDHRCMTRIGPERVIAPGEELLAGKEPMGGARPWVTPPGAENALWALG